MFVCRVVACQLLKYEFQADDGDIQPISQVEVYFPFAKRS